MRTKIKALALDLDRTLLHTDKALSSYTLSVLEKCRNSGIKLIIATARSMRVTYQYEGDIKPAAVIYNNGAVVEVGGRRLQTLCLDNSEAVDWLLRLQREYPHATLSAEISERLYANFEVPVSWGRETTVTSDFTNIPPEDEVYKILVGGVTKPELEIIASGLPQEYHIELADRRIGLILRREATKLRGLNLALSGLGIDIVEAAAFGDDYADIPMLQSCGVGVSPQNGVPEIKAVADYVCPSNDEDGVAKWIEENLL